MKKIVWFVVVLAIGGSSSFAQTEKPQRPLERRAADVCALFRQNPAGYQELFAPEFLAKVPESQLTAIFTQYFGQLGHCSTTKITKRQTENAAEFEFRFAKGFSVPVNISVSAITPNLIDGLWLGNPTGARPER